MRGASEVDLVVVGAGAAGLAAAKTAMELGLRVATFEAQDRIGGRAYTDDATLGFPWDAGCHWLHSASVNPFTAMADEYGFTYHTTPFPWRSWVGGSLVSSSDEDVIDAFIDGCIVTAMRCGKEGVDVPLADVVDLDSPWLDIFRYLINAEWGVDYRAVSTLDLSRYRDLDQNWPVEQGYGALVARAGAGVDVELNAPVASIDWSAPQQVRVTTPRGTVAARAAIVTASTGVLADEVIAFDPPLPPWKQEAFAAVPLGRANKIALRFAPGALDDVPAGGVALPLSGDQSIGFRIKPFGRSLADGYLGGPAAVELEAAGPEAAVAAATEALARLLGSDVVSKIDATAVTQWASEPYIRGAYAAARPGYADRRTDLGRPVDDRLFWAGEATSPEFFSTAHGAWETGIAAARAAAAAIRKG